MAEQKNTQQLEQAIAKVARVSGGDPVAVTNALIAALREQGAEVGPNPDAQVRALDNDNIVWST